MTIESFLKLVEIQTKAASVIPFILGTAYTLYRYKTINFKNLLFMFAAMITFDMATTAINNYMDYKKAHRQHGYNYESHNAIVRYKLTESAALTAIFVLLTIAAIFGVLLYMNTNAVILLLGIISFATGILYSYGPIPISRTPLGELMSGLFMGFIIVFISIYIHIYDREFIVLLFSQDILSIKLNVSELIYAFLISIPTICGIANIMLANNICDIEDDLENKRYTLPIYIGKKHALTLFKTLYYIVFADITLLAVLGIIPGFSLLVLLTLIPVSKNLKLFSLEQSKKDTFVLSVKNFVVINIVYVVSIGLGILLV